MPDMLIKFTPQEFAEYAVAMYEFKKDNTRIKELKERIKDLENQLKYADGTHRIMELEGKLEEAQELQAATAKTWFCEGVLRCINFLKDSLYMNWNKDGLIEKFHKILNHSPQGCPQKTAFLIGVEACMDIVERNVSPSEQRGHLKGLMAIIKYEDYN
jgi:hypothetical protein